MTTIVWFRQDLRLDDHPALCAAIDRGDVVPLYIWSPSEDGAWPPGGASRWWLHRSLHELDGLLRDRGSRLLVRSGPALNVLRDVVDQVAADAVFWHRRYEPAAIERDKAIKAALTDDGIEARSFNGSLLYEPWTIQTKSKGTPYKVFTPYWKACRRAGAPSSPVDAPEAIPDGTRELSSDGVDSLGLDPTIDWASAFPRRWTPGEGGARAALARYVADLVEDYADTRNTPSKRGTSRLSPHLHFGEVSPRRVWAEVGVALDSDDSHGDTFLGEIGWREFAHHVLYHFPTTPEESADRRFTNFPWRDAPEDLERWKRGQTGYPIVDAGMRELWTTGWMHNRVRMIVASFLIKDLLLPWQEGARWFWDTLVDADLASNTLGWQWAAGSGYDAAPYFRIFNPVSQSKRWDKEGRYIRRWVPELSDLPNKHIHAPWDAPPLVLAQAGVTLGQTYPEPIGDHGQARERALEAWQSIKG